MEKEPTIGRLIDAIHGKHEQSIQRNFASLMRDFDGAPCGYAILAFARQTLKNDAKVKRALDTIQQVLWIDE